MFDNKRKKLISYILVFSMICATLATVVIPTGATVTASVQGTGYLDADDVDYVTETVGSNTYTLNWGAQGELCVFLSEYAEDFYTGAYTYEALSQLAGGTSDDDAANSELYKALNALMVENHETITDYDDTKNLYKYTDCQMNDSSTVFLFYKGRTYSSAWNGKTWNQEHIWPNSKCITNGDQEDDSADIIMLRPAHQPENSSRNNTAYGESEGYFEPIDSLKGDCARVVLYYATRWGKMDSMVNGADGVIESIEILLEWMALDPVDTFEMGRNDAVESITGTRNVFVDYPELAWQMFGEDLPADAMTPSGNNGVITYMPDETPDYKSTPTVSGGKYTYTFSDYLGGLYIAKNETHKLDENLTLYTDEAHFTTELRLYQSTIGRSKAIFETKDYIHSLSINAGNNAGTLKIYASKDGSTWVHVDSVTTKAAYASYTVDITAGACRYIKIESTGSAIRLKSVTFGYGDKVNGAELAPEAGSGSGTTTPPTEGGVIFQLGANGEAKHYDGAGASSYTETQNGYTLDITGGVKMYTSARDLLGNSCIKLGITGEPGSFSFNVPEGVESVIIHAAQYKANSTTITVNGQSFTLTKSSNSGEYDAIRVDVPASKTITVGTTTSTKRCMINAIEFVLEKVEEETTTETEEVTTEAEETTTEAEETTTKVEETTSIEETTTKEEQTTTEAPTVETTETPTVETTEASTTEATETPTTEKTEETTTETTETPTIETTEISTTETTEATTTEATEPPVIETTEAPVIQTTEAPTEAATETGAETSAVGGVGAPAKTGCGSSIGGGLAVIMSISLAAIVVGRKKK